MKMLHAIWSARTRIAGWLTAVASAAYVGLPVLQTVVSTRAFAIATFSLGVGVALIGHFNTALAKESEAVRRFKAALADTHEPAEHAAANHDGLDGDGT